MINRLWHKIFHIVPGISPPASLSGLIYGSLGLIPGPIWKMTCNNLLILELYLKWRWSTVLSLRRRGPRGRDHMVVRFTTTYSISVYYHLSCEFESRSWWGMLDAIICDQVCQWLATCRWISPDTPVSFTNQKTDSQDITEILLKVTLNTITSLSFFIFFL